ncbi:hypothetical protein BJ546DRAFT_6655 [Cryomyces antarcticus]
MSVDEHDSWFWRVGLVARSRWQKFERWLQGNTDGRENRSTGRRGSFACMTNHCVCVVVRYVSQTSLLFNCHKACQNLRNNLERTDELGSGDASDPCVAGDVHKLGLRVYRDIPSIVLCRCSRGELNGCVEVLEKVRLGRLKHWLHHQHSVYSRSYNSDLARPAYQHAKRSNVQFQRFVQPESGAENYDCCEDVPHQQSAINLPSIATPVSLLLNYTADLSQVPTLPDPSLHSHLGCLVMNLPSSGRAS